MRPSQLKETSMGPGRRVLLRVSLPTQDEVKDINLFVENLMGRNPEKRFIYIQENAQFVKDLDV